MYWKRIIKLRTPSLIIKLGRRPDSSGGSNWPRRVDGPDPDPLRSPTAVFGASGGLISGSLPADALGSYSIFDTNIKFNEHLRRLNTFDNRNRWNNGTQAH